jgi:aminoglycoside 6-adenylyltransferase
MNYRMRSEDEMMELILRVGNDDERIRAVLLNGSRANPEIAKDIFQDFAIVYVVSELDPFMKDHSWIDVFGERIIMQLPEEMMIGEKAIHSFSYLVLFKDRNRIDLTLFPIDKLETEFRPDSLTLRLIDKDKCFENLASPTSADYLIKQPTEKLFMDCCNEFWWVSTYVGKGLWRNDIPYAKDMLEGPVRSMFMKIMEWKIGIQTNFQASFGQSGRNMKKYISNDLCNNILSTYPDSNIKNIWGSLFLMTDLFDEHAKEIAKKMEFTYNKSEASNVREHLKWILIKSDNK